ncbi:MULTISPECIES: excisionase [Streptococcaceae]|jgi:hypothetical protein|uniref:Excisionase n=1 Tax=Pseudolactococcus raffinolactis TaxID=1366 RepID=A0A6H0V056_9LACT|nr:MULTISPECIES: excisionase [Lactococcus]MBP6984874.1 excisionase [Lactococcus sp.]MBR2588655.1 excisionase [Bacilli bacterium]MBR3199681.1 excisionase [Bacilli bacterium]MBW9330804.1 excisionase [Lactococcus raffinolactis]MCH4163073.1 excisionase [Lactococcus raffinolactis]
MDINNFPDLNVSKQQLIDNYFPVFKMKTLEKYMTAIKKDDDFKCIITYGSPRFPMINVKGFFLYLQYRQSKMYK